jgi:excisionase family DNA binding protein
MTDPDELLTIAEAAAILKVHRDTLRRLEKRGQLAALRLPSGHRRYRRADIEALAKPHPCN